MNKYIYHFTTSETALLYILPSLKLKLSSFIDTNDPLENKIHENWSIFNDNDDLKAIQAKKSLKLFLSKKCKLTCFSNDYVISNNNEDHYMKGFWHPSMWAHYGDNYKGVCIVLDKSLFKNENIVNKDDYYFNSVKYTVPKVIFPKLDAKKWQENGDGYFKDFLSMNVDLFFFEKYYHWKSEDESRLVHFGEEEYCSIKKSIAGIYLGYNFDEKLLKLLKNLMPKNTWIKIVKIIDGRLFAMGTNHLFH